MADTKISALTAATALTSDDYLVFVDSPGGIPATKRITAANAKKYLGEVVNVVAYGATGDGSTDDAAAIQAAIDGAADGALVYFPPGVYIVGSTIKLKANCRYTGASRLRSWIKMKNASNLHAVLAAQAWAENTATSPDNPIHVEHLRIDGNTSNQTSGNGHGIALNNFWSTLRDLYIHDTRGDGILISSARQDNTQTGQAVENMVFRCDTRQIGGTGIHVYDPDPATAVNMPDGYIQSCKVETCTNHGIWLEGGAGWSLSENHVYGAKKSGIKVDRAYVTSITNNYLESVGTSSTPGFYAMIDLQGFAVSDVPTIISGNRGSQNMAGVQATSNMYGIYVYASSGATTLLDIVGNSLLGATHANTSHGLFIENQSATSVVRASVSGNLMTGWDTNTRTAIASGTFTLRGDMFDGYQAATFAASFTPNPHIGNVIGITLTNNITINAPANPHTGERLTFVLTQDGTGGRTTTFNSVFKFNWSPTTTASKINTISFVYNGTNWVQTASAVNL